MEREQHSLEHCHKGCYLRCSSHCASLEDRAPQLLFLTKGEKNESIFAAWMGNYTNVPSPASRKQAQLGQTCPECRVGRGRPGMLWKTTLSVAPQSQSLYNCDSFYWSWKMYFTYLLFFKTLSAFLDKLIHQRNHCKYNKAFKKSEIKSVYGLYNSRSFLWSWEGMRSANGDLMTCLILKDMEEGKRLLAFHSSFPSTSPGSRCKSWRERATSPFQKLMQHGSSSCRTHRLSGVYVALGRWEMVLSSRKHCSQGTFFNSCGWQTSVSGVLRKTLREIIVSKRETLRESQLFGAVCADGLLLCGGGLYS